jgi:hypothetical protein
MNTLKYDVAGLQAGHMPPHEHPVHDDRLAWDQPADDYVAAFRVCIDDQVGTECQDVGGPAGLNPRVLPSTTPGAVTYAIRLSNLTSFKPGKQTFSVVAYNDTGDASSNGLTVRGRSARHPGEHTR